MAVFTPVTPSQLEDWLQNYDLGDVVEFRGIASGIENSNFFLTTTHGQYVLTIFENLSADATAVLPRPDAPSGIAWRAGARSDAAPRRLRSSHELNGKPATIVTKLEGAPELAPTPAHCIEVGQMLARLHLAGRDFPQHQHNLRSLAWWQETVPAILPFLADDQRALIETELAHQTAFFGSADYASLPEGPCHCDLFRDNVLFAHTAGHVRLGGFFDFYFAGVDKWLFDVAVCVNDWCIDLATGVLDAARVDAMLRAYQTVRPFTPAEERHWNDMLRAGALRFWVSRLYDFHLPREAEMLKPHDPGHFERILRERVKAAPHPATR